MPKSFEDFKMSSDYHINNPFRFGDEQAKSYVLGDFSTDHFLEMFKGFNHSELIGTAAGLAAMQMQLLDMVRRIGTTVEALAQQGELVEQMAARMKAQPIYRGVYKGGTKYVPGNFVTSSGSVWHCNIPTTDKPGGGSPSWTLAVKSGARGN